MITIQVGHSNELREVSFEGERLGSIGTKTNGQTLYLANDRYIVHEYQSAAIVNYGHRIIIRVSRKDLQYKGEYGTLGYACGIQTTLTLEEAME